MIVNTLRLLYGNASKEWITHEAPEHKPAENPYQTQSGICTIQGIIILMVKNSN